MIIESNGKWSTQRRDCSVARRASAVVFSVSTHIAAREKRIKKAEKRKTVFLKLKVSRKQLLHGGM